MCETEIKEEFEIAPAIQNYMRRFDLFRGIHALYFMSRGEDDPAHLYVARNSGKIAGYVFAYNVLEAAVTWVYMHSSKDVIRPLLRKLPSGRVIVHSDRETARFLKESMNTIGTSEEYIMSVQKGLFCLDPSITG